VESQPEVNSVPDFGCRGPVGESAEPGVVPCQRGSSERRVSAATVDVTPLSRQSGDVGLDGAEALVGPVVVSVPPRARVKLGAEFVDAALVTDDLGFGLRDVVGEPVDLVEGGGLLQTASTTELGERPEFFKPPLGTLEAGRGCGQVSPG